MFITASKEKRNPFFSLLAVTGKEKPALSLCQRKDLICKMKMGSLLYSHLLKSLAQETSGFLVSCHCEQGKSDFLFPLRSSDGHRRETLP